MDVRVELPVRLDLEKAFAGERLHELAVDEPDAFLELGSSCWAGLDLALEVVEDPRSSLTRRWDARPGPPGRARPACGSSRSRRRHA